MKMWISLFQRLPSLLLLTFCFALERNHSFSDVELYTLQLYGLNRNVKPLTPNQFTFHQSKQKNKTKQKKKKKKKKKKTNIYFGVPVLTFHFNLNVSSLYKVRDDNKICAKFMLTSKHPMILHIRFYQNWPIAEVFEPRYDKTNKVTVGPAKTQTSLGIRPV